MVTANQESETHFVELVDDDPEAVDAMIDFFYSLRLADGLDEIVVVKLYGLSDKYGCRDLRGPAMERFKAVIESAWRDDTKAVNAMRYLYESTPDSDRGLRDICCKQLQWWTWMCQDGPKAKINMKKLLEAVPAYAIDVVESQLGVNK